MVRMPWGTYLWPGLPQLCREGSWPALGLAIGFAALLDAAVCATWVWSELASPGVRTVLWVVVGLVWGVSVVAAFRWDRRQAAWQDTDSVRDAFASAQDHYLKGNWFEAERILSGLVADNPRDVDAGLMRATLFRHTGRFGEAAGELERIERFESSRKWELEIRRERELLEKLTQPEPEESDSSGDSQASEPEPSMSDAA